MDKLQRKLIQEVEKIANVRCKSSPVAGGYALFYCGHEFAHFHSAREMDIRLGKKQIQALGLVAPNDSVVHPNRSLSSPWIELRYQNTKQVMRIVELVKLAVTK